MTSGRIWKKGTSSRSDEPSPPGRGLYSHRTPHCAGGSATPSAQLSVDRVWRSRKRQIRRPKSQQARASLHSCESRHPGHSLAVLRRSGFLHCFRVSFLDQAAFSRAVVGSDVAVHVSHVAARFSASRLARAACLAAARLIGMSSLFPKYTSSGSTIQRAVRHRFVELLQVERHESTHGRCGIERVQV